MHSYRVTTVHKIVYVHNVERVEVDDNELTGIVVLRFIRRGVPPTIFPMENVVSYEVTT